MKTLGQLCFEAAWKGWPLHKWEDADDIERSSYEDGAAAVAEECAKICDNLDMLYKIGPGAEFDRGVRQCANSIRDRLQSDKK